MTRLTPLKRPLVRRIGRLVVRLSEEGLEVKGYRKRKWWPVCWAQLASLAGETLPAVLEAERAELPGGGELPAGARAGEDRSS